MAHKSWDREPAEHIVPTADDHVLIAGRCVYCGVQALDVYEDLRRKCDQRVGNNDVPKSWSFGPEGNDMADYEDERGKFYVDHGDWDIRDYWGDETGPEDRPWRQQ